MEQQLTPTTAPTRTTAWLEHGWLVRYLDREFSGEEAAWFESYAMDKPDLLAGIEADTRLRDALAADAAARHMERSAVRGSRQGGASETAIPRRHPARRWRLSRRPSALAACLIAGLGIGWTGSSLHDAARHARTPIANPTRLVFDTMRGEPVPPRIENADSGSPLVFVEVALPPSAHGIVLKADDAPDLPLERSPEGFVSFVVPRGQTTPAAGTRIEYRLAGRLLNRPLTYPPELTSAPESL